QRVPSRGKPSRVHANTVVGRSVQNGRNGASPEKYRGYFFFTVVIQWLGAARIRSSTSLHARSASASPGGPYSAGKRTGRTDEIFLAMRGRRTQSRRAPPSVRNLRLHQLRQKTERLLPAEIARLWRDDLREPFLHDVHLRSAGHLSQRDRRHHLARKIRVVERVRVADAFVRHQLEVGSAERVTVAGGEVR